jgi:hypothetical protein
MLIPFIRPRPAHLPDHCDALAAIREAGIYSNYGPVNARFEQALAEQLFGGEGGCVTVCNATIGLMLAIREAVGEPVTGEPRYALMPSFTFAATAHAALWAGLTPLLCDVDEETWLPCAASEEALLRRHAGRVAVLVPYATFGNNLDLGRYELLSREYDVPIVVDAAASLGSVDEAGRGFGAGCRHAVVYATIYNGEYDGSIKKELAIQEMEGEAGPGIAAQIEQDVSNLVNDVESFFGGGSSSASPNTGETLPELPSGYTYATNPAFGSGTVIGPNGGLYVATGETDATSGLPVYAGEPVMRPSEYESVETPVASV